MDEVIKITLAGKQHAVTAPPSIIGQEELYYAWQDAIGNPRGGLRVIRVAFALVGMCTRIGRESGATYAASGCDALVYGGCVYDWFAARNHVDAKEAVAAAVVICGVLVTNLHALREAQSQADFSAPRGAV